MIKRKNILKFIFFVLIIALLIINIQTNVNAKSVQPTEEKILLISATDPSTNPDWWEPTIQDESEIAAKAGVILGVINTIGIVSSVIVAVMLGIKYMIGSVSEKAEFKKSLAGYITGLILLILCSTIPNLIYIIVNDEQDSTAMPLQSNYNNVTPESERVRGYMEGKGFSDDPTAISQEIQRVQKELKTENDANKKAYYNGYIEALMEKQ